MAGGATISAVICRESKMTNLQCAGYQMRDKTYADIATEIREWKEIYSELRKKGIECITLGKNDKGEEIKQEIKGKKTRELISEQLGISNGQIAKYGIRIYLLTPGYKYFYNCRSNETAVLKHLQQSKM